MDKKIDKENVNDIAPNRKVIAVKVKENVKPPLKPLEQKQPSKTTKPKDKDDQNKKKLDQNIEKPILIAEIRKESNAAEYKEIETKNERSELSESTFSLTDVSISNLTID